MIGRRDFLKLTALSAGLLAFRPFAGLALPEFPLEPVSLSARCMKTIWFPGFVRSLVPCLAA